MTTFTDPLQGPPSPVDTQTEFYNQSTRVRGSFRSLLSGGDPGTAPSNARETAIPGEIWP